jgi:hypothetical protein
MLVQQIIGIGFLALGLASVSCYTNGFDAFRIPWFYRELKPMQERWGKEVGTVLHVLGYVVTPTAFGILFLMGMVFTQ